MAEKIHLYGILLSGPGRNGPLEYLDVSTGLCLDRAAVETRYAELEALARSGRAATPTSLVEVAAVRRDARAQVLDVVVEPASKAKT